MHTKETRQNLLYMDKGFRVFIKTNGNPDVAKVHCIKNETDFDMLHLRVTSRLSSLLLYFRYSIFRAKTIKLLSL